MIFTNKFIHAWNCKFLIIDLPCLETCVISELWSDPLRFWRNLFPILFYFQKKLKFHDQKSQKVNQSIWHWIFKILIKTWKILHLISIYQAESFIYAICWDCSGKHVIDLKFRVETKLKKKRHVVTECYVVTEMLRNFDASRS